MIALLGVALGVILLASVWLYSTLRFRERTLAEMEHICMAWAEDADYDTRAALLELADRYRSIESCTPTIGGRLP